MAIGCPLWVSGLLPFQRPNRDGNAVDVTISRIACSIVPRRSFPLALAVLLVIATNADGAEPASHPEIADAWKTRVVPAKTSASSHGDDRKHGLKGIASYYWQGEKTASGERFDKRAMTAAHKTLPFNSLVRVKDSRTGNSVVVRINDRGPFMPGRVIDLSEKAAEVIGMKARGITPVELEVLAMP